MNTTEKQIVYIPVEKIFPHPDNPRKDLGDLTELAESIKVKGVLQNLTVVPKDDGTYTAVIGHRRRAASELAGLEVVPCFVTEMSYKDQLETMLLENIQRSDLTIPEQAQGFQMMIDLGESVETISQKTGFSTTTVRRRLDIAKLDKKTLAKVTSERQISISDLDKLSAIKKISARNDALKQIGTNNFEYAVNRAIKEQKVKEALPLIRKELAKLENAKEITRSDTYGDKYESYGSRITISDFKKGDVILKKVPKDPIFYVLDEYWNQLDFYLKKKKIKKEKRPQAEIDKEKYLADMRKKHQSMAEEAYELRKAFIDNLAVSSKNIELILRGAAMAAPLNSAIYISHHFDDLYNVLDIPKDAYATKAKTAANKLLIFDKSILAQAVYVLYGDCKTMGYFSDNINVFPYHKDNIVLDVLYTWLEALGYERSDMERQLCDGTHQDFVNKYDPKESNKSEDEKPSVDEESYLDEEDEQSDA